MRRRALVPCAAAIALSGPWAIALASNREHVRTPVIWDGAGACTLPVETPCMTLHDRGSGPLHIPYAIPLEDTEVGPEEPPQSRTHQLFGFCRGHTIDSKLPTWITEADVASADAAGLVLEPVPDAQILETGGDWDDCWVRLVDDADRRPITCEMAEAGVDWDTMSTPAGVYTVEGYTYEPILNLWSTRPGVVKLHDGDPDVVGPAVAVTSGEVSIHRNQTTMIEGCIDAPADSTMTVYWSRYDDGAPEWTPYGDPLPVDGDDLALEFAPPEATFGELIMLRFDVEDPQGRAYTAYMPGKIVVVNADGPCTGGGSFVGGSSCDDTGGSSSAGDSGEPADSTGTPPGETTAMGTASASGGESSGAPPEAPKETTCGCGSAGGSAMTWWGLVVLAARRRRALPRPQQPR